MRTVGDGRCGAKRSAIFPQIVRYWMPVVGYCLLIFFQSAYPAFSHTPNVPYFDKIAHGCIYAVLGFLCYRALRTLPGADRTVTIFFFSTLLATLYGVSDEIHQMFVVSRSAEFLDAIADLIGSIFGAAAAWGWYESVMRET